MENHPREQLISDFKQWLNEHKEQVQTHVLDELPIEDLDDEWEEVSENGEIN